jgi:hypothetical protein
MRTQILTRKWLWAVLVSAATLVAAPSLQAQCWSCVLGPGDNGRCYNIALDGYVECVSNYSYCSGVLPRCYAFASLGGDGSATVPERDLRLIDEAAPLGSFASFQPADGAAAETVQERRECDGAVVHRSYSPAAAADLRRRSRLLTI